MPPHGVGQERGLEIVDVDRWKPAEDPEQMGTRWKTWLEEPGADEVLWLFKAVRCKQLHDGTIRCFEEDWAEWLATELAGHLGVPAAPVRLARRGERDGVITRSLLVDSHGRALADRLEHGNELLQAADPTYDKDQHGQAVGYNLDAVWLALAGVGVPTGCSPVLRSATHLFAGILVLDALVANTDRHHENWGALAKGSQRWLAPSFDQGTCLGFQEPDEKRRRYLDSALGLGVDHWVGRGRSRQFEGEPLLVDLAIDALQRVPPAVATHWIIQVDALDLEWWRDTLEQVPPSRMSQDARSFAFEVVRLNRERLLDVYRSR